MLKLRTTRSKALTRLSNFTSAQDLEEKNDAQFIQFWDSCSKSLELNGGHDGLSPYAEQTMTFRQFEIIEAICQSTRSQCSLSTANSLFTRLGPYVPAACEQKLKLSPYFRQTGSSPWEVLASSLINAIMRLGCHHTKLKDHVSSALNGYLTSCEAIAARVASTAEINCAENLNAASTNRRALDTLALVTSLLGFLEASASHASFWDASEQRKILFRLKSILSESLLLACEAAVSELRNSRDSSHSVQDWKIYMRCYSTEGRPLGAMLLRQGFVRLAESCASLMVSNKSAMDSDVLRKLLNEPKGFIRRPGTSDLAEIIVEIAAETILDLEDGYDYLKLGTSWQQRRMYAVKSSALTCFACCHILNEDIAEKHVLLPWLETTLMDPSQAADTLLASTTLRCLGILARSQKDVAFSLTRSIPRFLMQGVIDQEISTTAAECLLIGLQAVPQDAVVTTLYSLGNSMKPKHSVEPIARTLMFDEPEVENDDGIVSNDQGRHASTVSLSPTESERASIIQSTIIHAIVVVAKGFRDEKTTALALPMLIQKVGKISAAADLKIISEAALLAVGSGTQEFQALLRLYVRLTHDAVVQRNDSILIAVKEARDYLGKTLETKSILYRVFIHHLLEEIISKGDTDDQEIPTDAQYFSQEIGLLIQPLSQLVARISGNLGELEMEDLIPMQRDAWYNLVVHGFTIGSNLVKKHHDDLCLLARYSLPLISEHSSETLESDIELNVVLRRAITHRNQVDHKRDIAVSLPRCEGEVKLLSQAEVVFLQAARLVESLRSISGQCHKLLTYFVDSSLHRGPLGNCLAFVCTDIVDNFLRKTALGNDDGFSAPFAAQQFSRIAELCCHPVGRVQQVAYSCAEQFVSQAPPVLCQQSAIFSILDILTLMWRSCLDSEIDEYDWKFSYTSDSGNNSIELSDNVSVRKATLRRFTRKAREWIMKAVNIATIDVKGLLQTYLSDCGDDDSFGHMSLGQSLALELGTVIPQTDERLGAIDVEEDLNINTASDFMTQYTMRQEYRFTDPDEFPKRLLRDQNSLITHRLQLKNLDTTAVALTRIEHRVRHQENVPLAELKIVLRRAASLLCKSATPESEILDLFVRIPFAVFNKQAIKLGLSLWTGVIKENPTVEPRLCVEVLENWISTVHGKFGIFSPRLSHVDPFYVKEEFAPSDNESLKKREKRIHDLLTPHMRILQFLDSHYHATRLSCVAIERAYQRFLQATLKGLRGTTSHPLAREVHFQAISLGLKILRYDKSLTQAAKWRLKDELLSVGLAWFAQPPRFSFGGNRVQVKSEIHVLANVSSILQNSTPDIALGRSTWSLQSKQDLLLLLLADEQTRLMVWLFPLDHGTRHHFAIGAQKKSLLDVISPNFIDVAWHERSSLAIHVASRLRSSALTQRLRELLLHNAETAISEPEALQLLLGSSLQSDISVHLKYLMYWAPVCPITAVTYFLPAYGNHPCIVQYAVKALESHSVDVTFFYVPQIVQTLRYDALGYIERFIVETAIFSQLFAHQIIWNMKANAYKDEDSTEPDSLKPTLDSVIATLTSSFSGDDRAFYEREFAFFNEITGISGKLRPFIKKSKPEKKQKIEEELRQIQVEVGVYLPSNPDGVVVGIDRKSGKPLQSHAKAPYMATFRIRKQRDNDVENTENQLEEINTTRKQGELQGEIGTYEVWQSAIFKVGDDCRQDVLALQMIAAFRGIFHHVGLPVYVFPYRVTATAPGCGVIDVLPKSISRDMLGREAVNGLYEWFLSRFGDEDAPAFQIARANLVKSLAAYSIISYLLQFKDRHNGNIMFDEDGHILHIDFGFCFDIAPGGVRFERAPFKLTKEMVAVMGGSAETQSFRWFEELCVKAFLASRRYAETLSQLVICMLDSGLPCFKPETIDHFKQRFVLEKNDKEAAEFVRMLVKKSYASYSTRGYDQFQLLTNGIPY